MRVNVLGSIKYMISVLFQPENFKKPKTIELRTNSVSSSGAFNTTFAQPVNSHLSSNYYEA